MPAGCKTCEAHNQEEQEAAGLLALNGEIPWSEVARRFDLPNIKGIQNHMARHYVAPPSEVEQVLTEFDSLLAESVQELIEQMRVAPAEVKPLYAVAIQNLQGINQTKPSQQHLINALKGIHEVTGMRMEQRLMLDFAKHHFGLGAGEAVAAIEQHADVLDVDSIEE